VYEKFINAANAGAAVAVKSAVKAASKRCLIAVPSKGPRIEAGTVYNYYI